MNAPLSNIPTPLRKVLWRIRVADDVNFDKLYFPVNGIPYSTLLLNRRFQRFLLYNWGDLDLLVGGPRVSLHPYVIIRTDLNISNVTRFLSTDFDAIEESPLTFAFQYAQEGLHLTSRFPVVKHPFYGRILEPLSGPIWASFALVAGFVASAAVLASSQLRIFSRALPEARRNRGVLRFVVDGILAPVHLKILGFPNNAGSGKNKNRFKCQHSQSSVLAQWVCLMGTLLHFAFEMFYSLELRKALISPVLEDEINDIADLNHVRDHLLAFSSKAKIINF